MSTNTCSRRWLCAGMVAVAGALLSSAATPVAHGQVVVDADFPGGNIVVEEIDGNSAADENIVRLRQDQRDTPDPWFYWHFRVRGAEDRRLTFLFTDGEVFGPRGPAVSRDGGRRWNWLGPPPQPDRLTLEFQPGDTDVRLAFCIPYVEADWRRFLAGRGEHPNLAEDELCRSKAGRPVERLRLGRLDGAAEHRVLLVGRHHACESTSGFLLEGLIDETLGDTAAAAWLREHVEFWIVPFMDKDGVEQGDQGKLRRPHDPWLDYAGQSIYPAVAALRERAAPWSDGRLRLALDLHAPARRDERIYFAGPRGAAAAAQVERFSQRLVQNQRGPLLFDPTHNLPYGQGWNVPATYGPRQSFAQWAESLPGVRCAATLEVPYAQVRGREVSPAALRRLGADLAQTVAGYLQGEE